jgi:hypothetical protein
MMITLRKAISDSKLDQFIAEREAEAAPAGDAKAFNRTLAAMAGTSKAGPKASKQGRSAG